MSMNCASVSETVNSTPRTADPFTICSTGLEETSVIASIRRVRPSALDQSYRCNSDLSESGDDSVV